jgi:hypothetical protein
MEFEFDKEIDAILRKTRVTSNASVATSGSGHVDADVIAAFAENVLPPKTKFLYTSHFADCDRCRAMLSQAIAMRSEADQASASSVSDTAVAASVPWYLRLFRTPNMALATGGLVIVFSALLGLLVLQNRESTNNTTVSQLSDQEERKAAPSYVAEVPADQANAANRAATSTNTKVPSVSNTTANSSAPPAQPATSGISPDKAPIGTVGLSPSSDRTILVPFNSRQVKELPLAARNEKLDELAIGTGAGKPAAAPPPEDKPAIVLKDKERDDAAKKVARAEEDRKVNKVETESNAVSEAVAIPMAKSAPNPSAAGPRQVQQQQSVTLGRTAARRSVGGKQFELRSGAWYDSAYHGQATTNVRRGTGDYEKLDKGLRSISDNLGGVVVVVWRSKAYRIQ